MPNCPALLEPQPHSVPSVLIAMVCPVPEDTSAQLVSVPTLTGLARVSLVPSPRRPSLLAPQVHSVPSVLIAEVNQRPVATDAQSESFPTLTGLGRCRSAREPSPICPLLFSPQPHSEPSARTAIVCVSADTADKFLCC